MRRVSGDIRTAPVPPGPSGLNVLRYWAQMMHDPLAGYGASGAITGTRCEYRWAAIVVSSYSTAPNTPNTSSSDTTTGM